MLLVNSSIKVRLISRQVINLTKVVLGNEANTHNLTIGRRKKISTAGETRLVKFHTNRVDCILNEKELQLKMTFTSFFKLVKVSKPNLNNSSSLFTVLYVASPNAILQNQQTM